MYLDIERIGRKIKQKSTFIALETMHRQTEDNPIHYFTEKLKEEEWQQIFCFIGEYLITKDESIKQCLIDWANQIGKQAVGTFVSFDLALHYLSLSRTYILEMMEEEFDNGKLSTKSLLEIIKIVEPLINLVSKTIINHYDDSLLTTRFALDESNEDLRITLRELSDLKKALNEATIFAVTDKDDRIIYANDKFCEITKFSKEELIGQNHYIYNSGYHSDEFFQEILRTIRSGKVWKGEILNQAKDGTKYWVDTTFVPFVDEEGKTYQHISIQYDITEKKEAEESLHKAEKLSMVGELAAGIAHEIRNPLTTIKGFVQLLSQSQENPHTLYSDIVLEEIDRINFIVSEFMVFAKPHTYYFSKCNITEIVLSVIKLLEAETNLKNVVINYEFPSKELIVYGERNQLKQVFLNIIKNGIEAMPIGGRITIKVNASDHDISISITDEGLGMNEEQIKRIGEPFYTTKETGNGLGLMVSHKIIHHHKGVIKVESELNKGTTFTITLPLKNEIG